MALGMVTTAQLYLGAAALRSQSLLDLCWFLLPMD